MTKTEKAVQWMMQTANDPRHGYDQIYRWGERGDYDCSSAVITAWEMAGVPVKGAGATYTGNMYSAFKKCGFVDVTQSVNLKAGSGLMRGDVLLNRKSHTAMYIGGGQLVQASINEKGTTTGGSPGDQTGKEFHVRSYYNFPWDYVLRYPEAAEKTHKKTDTDIAREVIQGLWGNGSDRIRRLRNAGYNPGEIQKIVNKMILPTPEMPTGIGYKVGDMVRVINAITYDGKPFRTWFSRYEVMEVSGDRIVIGVNGVVTAAINAANIAHA